MALAPVFVRLRWAPAGARLQLLRQVLRSEHRCVWSIRFDKPRVGQIADDVRVGHEHFQRALHTPEYRVRRPDNAACTVIEGEQHRPPVFYVDPTRANPVPLLRYNSWCPREVTHLGDCRPRPDRLTIASHTLLALEVQHRSN